MVLIISLIQDLICIRTCLVSDNRISIQICFPQINEWMNKCNKIKFTQLHNWQVHEHKISFIVFFASLCFSPHCLFSNTDFSLICGSGFLLTTLESITADFWSLSWLDSDHLHGFESLFWPKGCNIGIIQVWVTCSSQNQMVRSIRLRLTLGKGYFPITKLRCCFQKKENGCYIGKSHSYLSEILFLVLSKMESMVKLLY